MSGSPRIYSFNAQVGISIDTKGNVAVQRAFSGGVTGGTPSASVTVYKSRTNAPNINKLEGLGYQLGGSAGVPVGGVPLAGAVDFNILPDSAAGKNYYGTTTSFGVVKMRRLYILLMIILFGCICGRTTSVYAMGVGGFETEEMSVEDIESFLNNINLCLINTEPSQNPIKCFDANEQGMIAIGTEDSTNKAIVIYSDAGEFQYGYRFQIEGSYGVELNNEELKIYFVRSDVAISISLSGELKDISRICDTSDNNTYWNQYVRASSRNKGEYRYTLKNDIGLLGVFASTYSQLYRIDSFGNEQLIYNANSYQFFHVLIMFCGILVFVAIVLIVIVNEFKKLKR